MHSNNDDDGFGIIKIKKEDANKTKEHLHVFSKVCTKFYETMSKAQGTVLIVVMIAIVAVVWHSKCCSLVLL